MCEFIADFRTEFNFKAHLQLKVLLLELLIFIRVAVGELIYLDSVLLNLLSDLCENDREFFEAPPCVTSVITIDESI